MTMDSGYARGNYAMNGGTNDDCLMRLSAKKVAIGACKDGFQVDGTNLTTNTRQVWGSGIGGVNKSFAYREFTAGTDKAVAIEEIRAGVNSFDPRGTWALGFAGSSMTAAHGIYGKASGPNNAGPESDAITGCTRVQQRTSAAELAQLGMPCQAKTPTILEFNLRATSRSAHPGGVNLLMMGGSVHFVLDDIDAKLWHNLHKRNRDSQIEFP
jgi:hypothetical protein